MTRVPNLAGIFSRFRAMRHTPSTPRVARFKSTGIHQLPTNVIFVTPVGIDLCAISKSEGKATEAAVQVSDVGPAFLCAAT